MWFTKTASSRNTILGSRRRQKDARQNKRPRLEVLEDRCLLTGQPTLLLTGLPSNIAVGVHADVSVTALNLLGLINLGFADKIHFTSSDPLAILPADYTFTNADAGVHTFSASVIFNTPGVQSVSAQDLLIPLIGGIQAGINVGQAQAAAADLQVSSSGSPAAGTPSGVSVRAIDSNGNTVPSYTGTVHFTSSDSHAVLPADYTFTGGDAGSHTFTITFETSGPQTVSVTDVNNASLSGSTNSITVGPAPVSSIEFTFQPVTMPGGQLFSPRVTLRDAFGNVATNSTDPVSVKLINTTGNESLGGTITVTPVNGVANFPNLFIRGLALGVRLQASFDSLTQDSAPFNSIPLSAILPVVVAPVIYGPGTSSSAVESYVKGIYRTLLGRDADSSGLSYWVGQLSGGATRTAIINSFWNSPENRGREVDVYYHTYLGRNAEAQGRGFWIDQLQHGADETAIVDYFLLSPEELGYANEVFIERLYRGALGRDAGSTEVNYWMGQMQSGVTRQQMTNSFVFSPEAAGVALDSYYGAYLQRRSDSQGRAFWVAQVSSQQASYANVAKALLASDEFFANAGASVA